MEILNEISGLLNQAYAGIIGSKEAVQTLFAGIVAIIFLLFGIWYLEGVASALVTRYTAKK